MSLLVPDARAHEGHAIWGDPGAGCVISRGFSFRFPDLTNSDDQVLEDMETDLRRMVVNLQHDEKLQVDFTTGSEFTAELGHYRQQTERLPFPSAAREVREELFERFSARVKDETLIQAEVEVHLSARLPAFVKQGGRKVRAFDEVFAVVKRSISHRGMFYNALLYPYGGRVSPMDDLGHYKSLLRFWSPGQARLPKPADIDWTQTLATLCRYGEIAPRQAPDHGFFLDGHYFGLFVARVMPRSTHARMMDVFFALTLPGIRLVLNLEPLSVDLEIAAEEEAFQRLAENITDKRTSLRAEEGLLKHRLRMRELMANRTLPFRAQVIALVHDRTAEGLDVKMEGLRAAITKAGFQPYRPALPTSCIAYFNAATPGIGPWVEYRDYRHKIDDLCMVNLIPAGATPKADLENAHVIFDGNKNNLIGWRLFVGHQPLHNALAGTTRGGKSALKQTILLQACGLVKLIVVVEDGASYTMTCRKLDPSCRCLKVNANSNHTFNGFDTRKLPLSPAQKTNATALVHLLVGRCEDQDKDKLRAALIFETIQGLYQTAYQDWRKKHPREHFSVCKEAAVLLRFQAERMGEDEGFLDAFLEARALRRKDPEALAEFEDGAEEAARTIDRDPKTAGAVMDLAFSRFTPEMFPTLSDLQDDFWAASRQSSYHQELFGTLATLLKPWLRDGGSYGPIVDGPSNVDFDARALTEESPLKVIHFDLKMGQAEADLKAVVGFLITNQLRNEIMQMSRALRKIAVIEEMNSFLEIREAEKIVTDFYERFGKYNCQVTSIFQHYSSLLETSPKVAKAILSNSASLLLMRNHNRQELDALDAFLPIPRAIKDTLASFPLPESMRGQDDAYAGFVHVDLMGPEPRFTVGRNVQSRQVEAWTDSSGEAYEAKREELKNESRIIRAA